MLDATPLCHWKLAWYAACGLFPVPYAHADAHRPALSDVLLLLTYHSETQPH